MAQEHETIRWFDEIGSDEVGSVGGKNASLGEMIQTLKSEGIRVPDGFATTASAYRTMLEANEIEDTIRTEIDALRTGERPLDQVGKRIRRRFLHAGIPEPIERSIREGYRELSRRYEVDEVDVAVRSSATAEDLPEASFAGQQETFLNVTGADEVIDACRRCFASLFTDRAISYREEQGFDHRKIALSVGVQKMVRADRAGSGVVFTLDTETGFPDVVVIDAAWGLGENVVQGAVNPDEYVVFKPPLDRDDARPILDKSLGEKQKKMVYARKGGSKTTQNLETSRSERRSWVLSDDEILQLGRWATAIEQHYGRPMDIEWAKDGDDDRLYIVQARPETVQSQKQAATLHTYRLDERGEVAVTGLAIGAAIASGPAQVIRDPDESDRFEDGAVLVTGMTDPDWVPIMKRASAIVTDYGGRTSHAAIVSRELGIPAVVGTEAATEAVSDGDVITVSCVEGDVGRVYRGELDFSEERLDLDEVPETDTAVLLNIASPTAAFRWWRLPASGIGLARMEFIVNNAIKIHPMALVHYDELEAEDDREEIERLTRGYEDKQAYFVDTLARGIAKIAAPFYPEPVIVRLSDFKTNEYADLLGGRRFEPEESNPMLGWRGAARYTSDGYRAGFALECRALRKAREEMGMDNVVVMVPFCRTPDEADRVLEAMAENGLERGRDGLRVYVMAEIPSNVFLAERFAERFDGFSIGSNDLTQLVLGVDRDAETLSELFDERDDAVKTAVAQLIEAAHRQDTPVGICGQAPSDYPEFAAFLVRTGIDTISVNPDSLIEVKRKVAEVESGDGV